MPYGWDILLVAAVALGFCEWGLHSAYGSPATDELSISDAPELVAAGPA